MKFSVAQIAEILNGEVEGDGGVLIDNFAKIEEGTPGSITFLANNKYEPHIYTTEASVVIVSNDFKSKSKLKPNLIRVAEPYLAISKLMTFYQKMQKKKKEGISKNAEISESATLGTNVYIEAFCFVGDNTKIGNNVEIHSNSHIGQGVQIGDNCIIYPGVKIMDACIIGSGCVLHPGAIIGADGFGFAPDEEGVYQDIPQMGNVILGDNVSIGANAAVDRATMGSTKISNGVKIDNFVQIGHNVEIGENTVIASQSGVSGSTKIGKNCAIGGQVGIGGHLKIADGSKIGAKSGVSKSILSPNGSYAGYPLLPLKQHLRLMINLTKLK